MRRILAILALPMLCGALTNHAVFAGGHNHSGNHPQGNNNRQFKPPFSLGNKVLLGNSVAQRNNMQQGHKIFQGNNTPANNKNGMGFIADPVRRPLTTTTNKPKGNSIADPFHLPTNNPPRVAPVVRDHTLPNPNAVVSNPRPRYDSINGGGLGLDLNPFDFQAPMQFNQQVDKRTNPVYPGSGRSGGGHKQPWTPSSTGPANRSPVKP